MRRITRDKNGDYINITVLINLEDIKILSLKAFN